MSEHKSEIGVDPDLTVTLTLDDDSEVTCLVVCKYTAAGNDYIALLPLDEDESPNEEGHVFLYKYSEVDNEPQLINIESDDEYELASDAFDEWLDEQEFCELQASLDSID